MQERDINQLMIAVTNGVVVLHEILERLEEIDANLDTISANVAAINNNVLVIINSEYED